MAARFVGKVRVEWLNHEGADRDMRLLEPFAFIDEAGLEWAVPAGAVVNGASIPSAFWSFGPPFVGDYRAASAVHDHHCVVRTRPSRAVHRMFYDGCRAGGVSPVRAKTMYLAVKTFGPNWAIAAALAEGRIGPFAVGDGETVSLLKSMDADAFQAMRNWIETTDPDLDALDARADAHTTTSVVVPLPTS